MADWARAIQSQQVTLNGIKPTSLHEERRQLSDDVLTKTDIQDFFKEKILCKLPDTHKMSAVAYLMTSFHQGGLLYPVSASYTALVKNNAQQGLVTATSDRGKLSKSIHIVSTTTGFKIQELYTVNQVLVPPLDQNDPLSVDVYNRLKPNESGVVSPDRTSDYVFKAEATVEIDFSQNPSNPSVNIKSSMITYGNKALERLCDKRGFKEYLMDFLKNLVGLNKVQDLSVVPNQDEPTSTNDRLKPR